MTLSSFQELMSQKIAFLSPFTKTYFSTILSSVTVSDLFFSLKEWVVIGSSLFSPVVSESGMSESDALTFSSTTDEFLFIENIKDPILDMGRVSPLLTATLVFRQLLLTWLHRPFELLRTAWWVASTTKSALRPLTSLSPPPFSTEGTWFSLIHPQMEEKELKENLRFPQSLDCCWKGELGVC